MPDQKYKRLTRERTATTFNVAVSTRSSLWLGEDHLLQVESAFFTETYKRFFFRDIQAIAIRRTDRRMLWNVILGMSLGLSALIILTQASGPPMITWSCVVFIVFGIPLLLNNLFGPTCACQIRTAVQTENLPSLVRVRSARRVLNKIRPLIAATQGEMTPDEINLRMREIVVSEPSTGTSMPNIALPPVIS